MSDVLDRLKSVLIPVVEARSEAHASADSSRVTDIWRHGTMSKRVAVSVVALLLAAVAHTGFAQDLGVGGRIGPTFTTFGGDADPDSKTGFIVGGFFIYSFSELVSVYPELSYVRKGASSTRLASGGFDPSTGGFLEHTLHADDTRSPDWS
jgi:hypothetical protein